LKVVASKKSKFTWPLVVAVVFILSMGVFAGLSGCRRSNSNAIPPLDPQKADRMRQICVFPQTLNTKDELAVVYDPGSTASQSPSHKRHVPVLEEPYPLLVEIEAAIGKADLTDSGWMEWKENATDPANTNWYLRMAFGPDNKLKEIASRRSTNGPNGCKELRIGRAARDWSESARNNAECGPDCR